MMSQVDTPFCYTWLILYTGISKVTLTLHIMTEKIVFVAHKVSAFEIIIYRFRVIGHSNLGSVHGKLKFQKIYKVISERNSLFVTQ